MYILWGIDGSLIGIGLDPPTVVASAPDSSPLMFLVVALEVGSAIGSLLTTGLSGEVYVSIAGTVLSISLAVGTAFFSRSSGKWLVTMLSAYLVEFAVEGWLLYKILNEGEGKSLGGNSPPSSGPPLFQTLQSQCSY